MTTAVPGQQLFGNVGLWTNGVLGYSYELTRNGVVFQSGNWVTGPLYTIQTSDIGSVIAIIVIATNRSGSGPIASSVPISVLVGTAPVNLTVPVISGAGHQVGQTFTSTIGTWANNPTSYTFQWSRTSPASDTLNLGLNLTVDSVPVGA